MRRYIFTAVAIMVGLAGAVALAQLGGGGFQRGIQGKNAFTSESVPNTNPTATGTDSIAIGDGAVAGNAANDNAVIAIGAGANVTGADSIAIGENADATGASAIAIGGSTTDDNSADATGTGAIAIGSFSLAGSANGTIALGFDTEATADRSIAIGQRANASGANCIAIGGNITTTDSADCSAADSVALGQHVLADDIGEFAYASGEFSTQSDAHTSIYVLRAATTDESQTEMFGGASAGTVAVPSDCTNIAHIRIVARQANEDGTNAMYTITVGHGNDAGTTAELEAPTVTTVFESANASTWSVDTTADDTNDSINVLVTGAASDNINWVARVEVVESCG